MGPPISPKPHRWRLLLAVALILAIIMVCRLFRIQDHCSLECIQSSIRQAGVLGYAVYLLAFTAGTLLNIFGLLFVAAGVCVYGKWIGLVLALVGGTLSVSVSFLFMRAVGGIAFNRIQWPMVRRALARLDRTPIRSVIFLRTFLILHASLNYLLALTPIRFRDYLIGSAIGLILPISLFVFFFDLLMNLFF